MTTLTTDSQQTEGSATLTDRFDGAATGQTSNAEQPTVDANTNAGGDANNQETFTQAAQDKKPSPENLLMSLLIFMFDINNTGTPFSSSQSSAFGQMLGFGSGFDFMSWFEGLLNGELKLAEAVTSLPNNGQDVDHDRIRQYSHEQPIIFQRAAHYENLEGDYPGLSGMLAMIRDAEHSRTGDLVYNTAFGNRTVDFTSMTVDQVLQWQLDNNPPGQATAAAGAYQIIRPTLAGLKESMGLRGNELFDKNLQDTMAIKLLEGRGLGTGISNTQLLARAAQEWASLPKDTSGLSHYDKDGINSAQIDYSTAIAAINGLNEDSDTTTPSSSPGMMS